MKENSFKSRNQNIQEMSQHEFDLIIVGGGINGAGIARDASLRGLKVALIESSDFASGTSSRSSKLIHGGIRYLENFDFKLVFEALNERTKLFSLAPHLVHELRFMIPLFESSRVGMLKMGLGMWAYDALSLFQAPELHERLNAKNTIQRMGILKNEGLLGSYVYSDAYMDDDRLVHETLRSAIDAGALIGNYLKAQEIQFSKSGKFQKLKVYDLKLKNEFWIKGKHLISSVGPWTDIFGQEVIRNFENVLRPTKGIHLTFSKDRLPLSSAVVMGAEKSDRIVFGIPRHEMVIVGTTDTDFTGDPSEVRTNSEDVDYLLSIVNVYFPGAKIKKSDILSCYAGVRPLVRDQSSSEGKTSREHSIWSDPRGITFVAGGKYTTYRLMSQQVVEFALKNFDIEYQVRFSNSQSNQPLNKYVEEERYRQTFFDIENLASDYGFSKQDIKILIERHGGEVYQILESGRKLKNIWEIEALYAVRYTMCLHLTDFMTRRVPLFLADPNHGQDLIEGIGRVFQNEIGWSQARLNEEIELYQSYINKELSWK
jgi:glycerol-3-phosphate dehydrogenase